MTKQNRGALGLNIRQGPNVSKLEALASAVCLDSQTLRLHIQRQPAQYTKMLLHGGPFTRQEESR